MRRQGPEVWRKLGGAPALTELGLVDPDALSSFVHARLSNGDEAVHDFGRVWNVLRLEAWLQPRLGAR
jgi:hypothetical protein